MHLVSGIGSELGGKLNQASNSTTHPHSLGGFSRPTTQQLRDGQLGVCRRENPINNGWIEGSEMILHRRTRAIPHLLSHSGSPYSLSSERSVIPSIDCALRERRSQIDSKRVLHSILFRLSLSLDLRISQLSGFHPNRTLRRRNTRLDAPKEIRYGRI